MSGARLAVVGVCLLAACTRSEPKKDRTEPWPAPGASTATSGPTARERVEYTLARSKIEFELPARRATPRGKVRAARGELSADFGDLSQSRARVEVDLTTLELDGDTESGAGADATARALAWLELGAEAGADLRENGRFATFSLRSLTSSSTPRSAGNRPGASHSEWLAQGDLGLHGVRAPETSEISVDLAETAAGAVPLELVIRSRKPLVIPLGTHDIRPRDPRGQVLSREASLLGDSVGREVRVTFELVFVPSPTR